jgi:hypothetical protein
MAALDTCRSVGLFLLFLLTFFHISIAGKKTLILLDNANTKETHSIFFGSLKGMVLLKLLIQVMVDTLPLSEL